MATPEPSPLAHGDPLAQLTRDLPAAAGPADLERAALAGAVHRARLARREQEEDARLRLLGAVSLELDQTLGADERLRRLMQLLVPGLADLAAVRMRTPGEPGWRLAAVAHRDPALEQIAARLHARASTDSDAPGPGRVMARGEPALLVDIPEEAWARWAPDEDALADARALGSRSWICVPLTARGEVVGCLSLLRGADRPRYDAGTLALAEDIGRRAGLAIENARLFEGERAMGAAMDQARAREELLRRVTAALSRAVTAGEVADVIVVDCMAALGALAGVVAVLEGAEATVVAARGYPGEVLRVGSRIALEARLPLPWVLRTGEPRWLQTRDDWFRDFDAPSSNLGPVGVALPLIVEGRVIGSIAFRFAGEERRFTSGERRLVETLAELCAQALDRARLFDVQRSAAEVLQRRLLPEGLPRPPGMELAVRYLPAADGLAGGDFYDCAVRPDGVVGMVVGDVVGHGVEAASAMGQLRSSWRILQQMRVTPGRALEHLDRFARDVEGAAASTAACVDVHADGTIAYACAGHPPPLLAPRDGPPRYLLDGRGAPLGMGLYRLAEGLAPFGRDDVLLLFTDGVVERRGRGIDVGLDGLREVVGGCAGRPLEELLDAVVTGMPPGAADDRALLAVRRSA